MGEVIDILSDSEDLISEESLDPIIIKNKFSVTLKESDYSKLNKGVYINDNIVDFILNAYISTKSKNFHAFNCFFYLTYEEHGFDKIQKWYKSVDIFSKKYWLIPIAIMDHWLLVIIANPKNALTKKNPPSQMLLFDSMNSKVLNPQKLLEKYIKSEWKQRTGQDVDDIDIPLYFLKLPQQENLYDCGIYMLEYANEFIKRPRYFCNPNKDYTLIFEQLMIEDNRDKIKNFILQIAEGVNIYNVKQKVYLMIPRKLLDQEDLGFFKCKKRRRGCNRQVKLKKYKKDPENAIRMENSHMLTKPNIKI
ncbi:hypothetical protein SteCoe_18357 [Stentor coeruleus]|uniref:Ubiquitin-like protease family profile domain-containing protein n=1 Tax=Stentor coeruleus TaxID=5963 RepID=A0A1R2BWQ1_9CILI|nr:hypothetical protein SteCoe_18357 [Stentor coeruleus]